jgi:hypothetical protein
MRSPRLRAVLAAVHWGAARGLDSRTRHPSHGNHPVWLLDFCRCSNQKCCAAPRELCAKVSKLQWLAPTLSELLRARHVERDRTARPATRASNDAFAAWGVRPLSLVVTSRALATPRSMARLPRPPRSLRPPGPDVGGRAAPAGPARLPRCKTQYKCGNSRLWHNHPLGKPGYDQRLLLAPALLLSLE